MGDAIEPEFDSDGYPTEATLRRIREWSWQDLDGLFDFIGAAWYYPEYWDAKRDGDKRIIACSTGGWSGNEDLIQALKENSFAWAMTWYSVRRGGHYKFRWRRPA